MRIFAAHDESGCGYYRLKVPLTEVGLHGHEVTLTQMGSSDNRFVDPYDIDVYVGQRLANFGGLKFWRELRKGHNRLVYENDDDVFAIDPTNPVYGDYTNLHNRASMQAYVTYADLVTVTGEPLADVFEEYSAQRPVALPNFIREFVLELPRTERKRLRLGYMGGASHVADVALVTEHVRRFMRQNPEWDFALTGIDYRPHFRVPADQVSLTPWVKIIKDDEQFYRNIDFDVAIAPLTDTRFNRSKSYLKALEYNARGIPVVASNVGPYKDYIEHGVNGFLVNKPHEWGSYLNLLANDDDLRETMGKSSRAKAAEHTIEKNWKLWIDAYEGMWN